MYDSVKKLLVISGPAEDRKLSSAGAHSRLVACWRLPVSDWKLWVWYCTAGKSGDVLVGVIVADYKAASRTGLHCCRVERCTEQVSTTGTVSLQSFSISVSLSLCRVTTWLRIWKHHGISKLSRKSPEIGQKTGNYPEEILSGKTVYCYVCVWVFGSPVSELLDAIITCEDCCKELGK